MKVYWHPVRTLIGTTIYHSWWYARYQMDVPSEQILLGEMKQKTEEEVEEALRTHKAAKHQDGQKVYIVPIFAGG